MRMWFQGLGRDRYLSHSFATIGMPDRRELRFSSPHCHFRPTPLGEYNGFAMISCDIAMRSRVAVHYGEMLPPRRRRNVRLRMRFHQNLIVEMRSLWAVMAMVSTVVMHLIEKVFQVRCVVLVWRLYELTSD